jgi:hypothetical protein
MPIQLSDILKDTKEITFDYEGNECTIVYRHKALTPIMRVLLGAGSDYIRSKRESQQPKKKGKKGEAPGVNWQDLVADVHEYLGAIAGLLVTWDVLDDEGEPLPITVEWLEHLPMSFINSIAGAMLTDGLPNPQNGKVSPDTLPPMDS